MESNKKLSLSKKIEDLWNFSQPYRTGFVLGFLAVSLTLVLILTGQKSEKMSFKAQPRSSVAIASPSASLVKPPPPTTLGASTVSTSPVAKKTAVAETSKININSASAVLLESLPQIGPVTAKRITDYRAIHGLFKSINELDKVKGIGPKTIDKIRNLISVE